MSTDQHTPDAPKEPTDAQCSALLDALSAPLGSKPKRGYWTRASINRCRAAIIEILTTEG